MDKEQEEYLVKYSPTAFPTRALVWAYFLMPKKYKSIMPDGEIKWRHTKSEERFPYLKTHREDYYKFLEDHGLEKNVYDRFIGVYEKEEKIEW